MSLLERILSEIAYFRRIWCPPFVKGPADKPLVPKVRKLVAV